MHHRVTGDFNIFFQGRGIVDQEFFIFFLPIREEAPDAPIGNTSGCLDRCWCWDQPDNYRKRFPALVPHGLVDDPLISTDAALGFGSGHSFVVFHWFSPRV